MAALIDLDKGYTKTGNGGLTVFANKLSAVPFIGGWLSYPIGMLDTAIESIGWLLRGKVMSAVTTAAAGTVGNTVNALSSSLSTNFLGKGSLMWWGLNAGSGVATGKSLGTHARALTESAIGGLTGALGAKPQVLKSYTAGMGSVPGSMAAAGPGRYVTQVAQSRGEDPDAAYARLQSGQSDHMAALEAARAQPSQSNYLG